jgi:hypothetical protein
MERQAELFEMPEFGKGILTLELELEKESLADPGAVKYAGRLLIPGDLPTPLPAFSRVVAEMEGKEPIVSDDIIMPWPMLTVKTGWEWWHPTIKFGVIMGGYTGELTLDEVGEYKIHAEAYPTPLKAGPTLARTDPVSFVVGKPPRVFRFSQITIDGHRVELTDHDADSGLLLEKTTADFLEVIAGYQWTGPETEGVISIKAGYKDWMGGFSPKTDAYTTPITLPSSPDVPVEGEAPAVRVPLTACGGITDGAIEVVLKVEGIRDYISHIWNVYATTVVPEKLIEIQTLTLS